MAGPSGGCLALLPVARFPLLASASKTSSEPFRHPAGVGWEECSRFTYVGLLSEKD
jgi:hypothetical protein